MNLSAYLTSKGHFTEEECTIIDGAFESERIPKGTVFQKVNTYSHKLLFIETGLLRIFYVKEGKDITHFFFDENHFLVAANSILNRKSERYIWESIEPSTVRVIPYEDFLILGEQFPKLNRLVLDFSIYLLDLFSQKLNLLQFQSAYERYNLFLEMYPNLHNRVSLGSIASFLGVTQQTLSVIRAKKK